MDIAALMAEFARDTGTTLELPPGGQLSLAFDRGETIDLEHEPATDTLFVKTAVGVLPTDIVAKHLLLLRLLVANGFDPVTQSAAIACEADEKTLILIAKLPVSSTTAAGLSECIERMVAQSGTVSSAIANAHATAPTVDAAAHNEKPMERADLSQIFNHA